MQAEIVSEFDGRPDDDGVALVLDEPQHERLVDLDLIDGQTVETRQRRLAGAEVVDGDRDSHAAQPVQDADGATGIDDERAFGDLERER